MLTVRRQETTGALIIVAEGDSVAVIEEIVRRGASTLQIAQDLQEAIDLILGDTLS